jgi:amino acid transporter
VHPRFRTPHVAIVASAAVALAIGLAGSFAAAAALSAIARLVLYAVTCAALVALRRPGRRAGGGVRAAGGALDRPGGDRHHRGAARDAQPRQSWGVGAIVLSGLGVWAVARARRAGA